MATACEAVAVKMDVAKGFLLSSMVLRVAFGFSNSELGERALGTSGGIGFIGICRFAIVAFQALASPDRAAYSERASEFGQI